MRNKRYINNDVSGAVNARKISGFFYAHNIRLSIPCIITALCVVMIRLFRDTGNDSRFSVYSETNVLLWYQKIK